MEDLLSETTDFDSSETSTLVLSGSDAGHFQIDFPSSALSSGSTAVGKCSFVVQGYDSCG